MSVAVWVATPVAQTAAFVVQVAGPVAGMAGGVAALFRPEAGKCFLKAGSFCERPVRKAALCGTLHPSLEHWREGALRKRGGLVLSFFVVTAQNTTPGG